MINEGSGAERAAGLGGKAVLCVAQLTAVLSTCPWRSVSKPCSRQSEGRVWRGGGRDGFIKIQPCCILTNNSREGVAGEENSPCSRYRIKQTLFEDKMIAVEVGCRHPPLPGQEAESCC